MHVSGHTFVEKGSATVVGPLASFCHVCHKPVQMDVLGRISEHKMEPVRQCSCGGFVYEIDDYLCDDCRERTDGD